MSTRKIVYIALFASIGIVLPQVFHIFGGQSAGSIFLPMQLPLFIGAMLLGPFAGFLIGVLTVWIGAMLGMPPIIIGLFMTIEMGVYGLSSGYLYYVKNVNIYITLLLSKVLGMGAMIIAIKLALSISNISLPPLYGSISMFAASIPGIVIQFILVPILVLRLKKNISYEA